MFRKNQIHPRLLLLALAFAPSLAMAATYTANLNIGQLRSSSGAVIADGGGVWAVIVGGSPGAPPVGGSLPGGLTAGNSLTGANLPLIAADFDSVVLTEGAQTGFTIHQVGVINGFVDSGFVGIMTVPIDFPVVDGILPGYTVGTLWGVYWFPGKGLGDTLSGAYEVGGFADTSTNLASGSEAGTTIVSAGGLNSVNFYETDFNVVDLSGDPTGLGTARFTAVAVPEPGTLSLLALTAFGWLRRRRNS